MSETPHATGTAVTDRGRAAVEAILQGRSRSAVAISLLREAALLPVLILLIVVGSFVNSAFLTVSNISGIGQQISALGVVVVGESLILLIGGMDLSLEGTLRAGPDGRGLAHRPGGGVRRRHGPQPLPRRSSSCSRSVRPSAC